MRGIYLVWFVVQCVSCVELLKNPGFESTEHSTGWGHYPIITDDVHGGTRALKATGRSASWDGPGQDVPVHPGERYTFKSTVKQLNDKQGKMYQPMKAQISYAWEDNGGTTDFNIATHPFSQSSDGWFSLDGEFIVPLRNFTKAYLIIRGPDADIEYIIDDVSLQPLSADKTWKSEADARIQKIRKNNINVSVKNDASLNPADIEIKIDLKRHLFGFGTLINEDWITNPDFKEYQNLVYDLFNWATTASFSWKSDRGTQGNPDYQFAIDAVKELKKHGMKVRGHDMFWGVRGKSPTWAETMDGTILGKTIADRAMHMTQITKGLIDNWVVNNEMLHGHFYEEKTGDPKYSEKMYGVVHKANANLQLYLNDGDVLATGAVTDAYVEQATSFKNANVGVSGLGLESHFPDHLQPDPVLLQRRLDTLAAVGLPLWITELDLVHDNDVTRADWYEMALRTYFSHPAVEGVTLWGFWDRQMKSPYASLVIGQNFYMNAAGKRYYDLVKKEWSTHSNHSLSSGSTYSVHGFHGDYEVVVYNKGVPILYQEFSLANKDITLNLHITGNGPVNLPTTVDPFEHITHPIHASHNDEHEIGRSSGNMQNKDLQCVTRSSPLSPVGDDKATYAFCEKNEVLTSCSSIQKAGDWRRDGEILEIRNGKIACKAVDGFKAKDAVQAVVRCCKTRGLQCVYRGAGPSDKSIAAAVETTCKVHELATGCSAWSWDSEIEGAFPSADQKGCIAQNDGGSVGTWSYAACCSAPGLNCKTVTSQASGLSLGNMISATCDQGYVMTGCSVRADFGRSAGSYIGGDLCIAVNGEDKEIWEEGVRAVAVCCKLGAETGGVVG